MKIISLIAILIYLIIFSSNVQANTLIIVRGPVNSGRADLCNAFTTLDNSYKIVSQDDIYRKTTYEICRVIFPAQMATICKAIEYENIWHAIKYENFSQAIKDLNIIFIDEMNDDEKQSVVDAIIEIRRFFDDPINKNQWLAIQQTTKKAVMEQLFFYAACGHNVIFNSWAMTNWDYEFTEFKQCFDHVIGVVCYCSFETILKRWNAQNELSIQIKNHTKTRLLSKIVNSFFTFFTPAQTDEDYLITITKQDFDTVMQKAINYIEQFDHDARENLSLFSDHEFTVKELLTFKKNMYTRFDFTNKKEVTLTPSIPYDILLCTENNCSNCAQELLSKIKLFIQ